MSLRAWRARRTARGSDERKTLAQQGLLDRSRMPFRSGRVLCSEWEAGCDEVRQLGGVHGAGGAARVPRYEHGNRA